MVGVLSVQDIANILNFTPKVYVFWGKIIITPSLISPIYNNSSPI